MVAYVQNGRLHLVACHSRLSAMLDILNLATCIARRSTNSHQYWARPCCTSRAVIDNSETRTVAVLLDDLVGALWSHRVSLSCGCGTVIPGGPQVWDTGRRRHRLGEERQAFAGNNGVLH